VSARRRIAIGVAVLALAGIAVDPPGPGSSQAAPSTGPAVTAQIPDVTGRPLRGTVGLAATATASAGRTIASVEFQLLRTDPAGSGVWSTIGAATPDPATPDRYTLSFDTTALDAGGRPVFESGVYDMRAVATDSTGETGTSALARDRVIAVFPTAFVALDDPGAIIGGAKVKLSATPETGQPPPSSVTYQFAPAGSENWTTIGTADPPIGSNGEPDPSGTYTLNWDTTGLSDGLYDVRVHASYQPVDENDPPRDFVSRPVRDRRVDNTPPTSSLSVPGGTLSGEVTLSATADDNAGAGVAGVRFERAAAGSGTWVAIGARTRPPLTQTFDTRLLEDGRYDLRVVATDVLGNSGPSAVVHDVEVSNPGRVTPDRLSIENIVAPAHDLQLLGAVAGSPEHEAWAIGRSGARPAVGVNGDRLPYTSLGNQIVLLRYTDGGGWQIADVLRNTDGGAFDQGTGAAVIGQMTSAGEAWVVLKQASGPAVFHRVPGVRNGGFILDAAATETLRPLVAATAVLSGSTLRLGRSADGSPYGIFVGSPGTQTRALTVGGVTIQAAVDYDVLRGGAWSARTAGLPPDYAPRSSDRLALAAADMTGPDAGWAALTILSAGPQPLQLARFDGNDWTYVAGVGLDALDLTGRFRNDPPLSVTPKALRADGDGVWINAQVGDGRVIARYDASTADVTRSWCRLPRASAGCAAPLDPDHPAMTPDTFFDTPDGRVALALNPPGSANDLPGGFLHVFAHGDWTRVPAPGFTQPGQGSAVFTSPTDGWLAGSEALGRVTAKPTRDPLAPWPQPNRAPLTSVALAPGGGADVGASGALAVGLDGTALRYDAAAGWLVDPVPPRARRLVLRGVAFAGPASAFAVGQRGVILHSDGESWSEDPASVSLTQSDLNAVAFAANGEGWAVGRFGTILHYDGASWSAEQPPNPTAGPNLTSVTVAGSDVYAVDDGNLIVRRSDGSWRALDQSELPADLAPDAGDLRLVSGLANGGVVAAGRNVLIVRQPGGRFATSAQPIEGIAVALQAFRDPGGDVRAFVSLAPPAASLSGGLPRDVAGFPPGDGNLLRQTNAGWEDLSRGQFPSREGLPGDGVVKVPPVLAIAGSPDGAHAWVVGGYAGTASAARLGTGLILPARSRGWQSSQIWRYDSAGSAASPALRSEDESLPAQPHTVSFAFFSSAMCKVQCAATRDAQPDINLAAAARQIASFAAQPGGPSFAVLGGNARGPIANDRFDAGNGAIDFTRLPGLLAPLGDLPLYAAISQRDNVPGQANPAQPWADAFARARAPFGPVPAAGAITAVSAGAPVGAVHRYYAFDASQNGGRLRGIVLDDSCPPVGGTLGRPCVITPSGTDTGALDPDQVAWLADRLADAKADGIPVVVFLGRPLGSSDADAQLANVLTDAGVLAVFAGGVSNTKTLAGGTVQYSGASLGYQQPQNNGVLWYSVSVDTATRKLDVNAVPVIESLALKPLLGRTVARSSTLAFEAVARRPQGSLATFTSESEAASPGFDEYVGIPATDCGATCIKPAYRFRSSDPTIGDFVQPSGPTSRFPKLDAAGKPIPSSSSGLFCAFNSGDTTVSISAGLLRASLPITVEPGGFGRPCGTVFREGVGQLIIRSASTTRQSTASAPGAPVPPPATPPASAPAVLPNLPLPAPHPSLTAPPAPAPAPKQLVPAPEPPSPVAAFVPPVPFQPTLPVIAVPPLPGTVTPVPPGGSASAQAAARKKERVKKHAKQSAFTTRPPDVSATEWFYPAVGTMSVIALLLIAGGVTPRPRPRPALLTLDDEPATRRHRP
jgi:hypothetical protein